MIKAALAKLLGSPKEAAFAADSGDEKDSDSDGIALSDDEDAGPLALRVGSTMMFFTNKVNSAPILPSGRTARWLHTWRGAFPPP